MGASVRNRPQQRRTQHRQGTAHVSGHSRKVRRHVFMADILHFSAVHHIQVYRFGRRPGGSIQAAFTTELRD
jgi:hypothetical protein